MPSHKHLVESALSESKSRLCVCVCVCNMLCCVVPRVFCPPSICCCHRMEFSLSLSVLVNCWLLCSFSCLLLCCVTMCWQSWVHHDCQHGRWRDHGLLGQAKKMLGRGYGSWLLLIGGGIRREGGGPLPLLWCMSNNVCCYSKPEKVYHSNSLQRHYWYCPYGDTTDIVVVQKSWKEWEMECGMVRTTCMYCHVVSRWPEIYCSVRVCHRK